MMKFFGVGIFGSCYLVFYRDMVVVVKEFKERKNVDFVYLRSEECYEVIIYHIVISLFIVYIIYVKLFCLILLIID